MENENYENQRLRRRLEAIAAQQLESGNSRCSNCTECSHEKQRERWRLQAISEGIAGDYAAHEKVFIQMAENGLRKEPSPSLNIEKLSPEEKWKLIDKTRRLETK